MWGQERNYPAWEWWEAYVDFAPDLLYAAVRVLALPGSSSACERNWSTFAFIHDKRRNKLHHTKARKLVYVFTSMKLLRRTKLRAAQNAAADVIPWQWTNGDSESSDFDDSPDDSDDEEGQEGEQDGEGEGDEFIDDL